MKKLLISVVLFSILLLNGYAKSNNVTESVPDINKYYALPDNYCYFILEFENQSEVDLTITNCIFNRKKRKTFNPVAKSEDMIIAPGECRKFRYNTKDMIKDYSSLSIGFYCYEKDWYWWYDISTKMNYNHMKVIVKSDSNQSGDDTILYPKFKGDEDKNLDDFFVESGYDFIYEVKNNTSGNISVQPVLDQMYVGPLFGDGIFAVGKEVVIEKGKSHQFKYKISREKDDPLYLNLRVVVFGSYIKLDGVQEKGHIGFPFIDDSQQYENGQNNLIGMKLAFEVTDDFLSNRKPLVIEGLEDKNTKPANYKGKPWVGGYQGRMKEGSWVVKLLYDGTIVFERYDDGFNKIYTVKKGKYTVNNNTITITTKQFPETIGTASDNWESIDFSGIINGTQTKASYIPYE